MAEEIKKRSDIAQRNNFGDYFSKDLKSTNAWQDEWGFLAEDKIKTKVAEPSLKSKE